MLTFWLGIIQKKIKTFWLGLVYLGIKPIEAWTYGKYLMCLNFIGYNVQVTKALNQGPTFYV